MLKSLQDALECIDGTITAMSIHERNNYGVHYSDKRLTCWRSTSIMRVRRNAILQMLRKRTLNLDSY